MATESENKAMEDLLRRETVVTTGSNLLIPVRPHPGQLLGPNGKAIYTRDSKENATPRTRGKQQQ